MLGSNYDILMLGVGAFVNGRVMELVFGVPISDAPISHFAEIGFLILVFYC